MAVGIITISGLVNGLPSGTKTFQAAITALAALGETLDLTLSVGNTSVAVPTGATAVLLVPPPANVVPFVLKGASGDVGVALAAANPTLLALDPLVTTLVLSAVALLSGPVEVSFL